MLYFSVYGCIFCLVRYLSVISTSVIDCLGRFVPEMTYYVSSGTLNLAQLDSLNFYIQFLWLVDVRPNQPTVAVIYTFCLPSPKFQHPIFPPGKYVTQIPLVLCERTLEQFLFLLGPFTVRYMYQTIPF